MSDEQDENPLAGRAAESGIANTDGEVDDVPDWLAFASFAKTATKDADKSPANGSINDPIIPKRGEKDFEPATEASHVYLQQSLLDASRDALFNAIGSGVRSHSSKSHNRAVWDQANQKAYMIHAPRPDLPPQAPENAAANYDGENGKRTTRPAPAHGIHFQTMGSYNNVKKRLELLPEEVLYLIERGTVECWTSEAESAVPMSFQHAWGTFISTRFLTAERYQVYAYLRRLGYTVMRDGSFPRPNTSILNHRKESLVQRIRAYFVHPLERFAILCFRSWSVAYNWTFRPLVTTPIANLGLISVGKVQSLLNGQRWATFDQIFTALQVVPAGWVRGSGTHNKRQTNPYRVVWKVYKPITKIKKSDPPEPDFRISVINASELAIPDLFDFENIFAELPFPAVATVIPYDKTRAHSGNNRPRVVANDLWSKVLHYLPSFIHVSSAGKWKVSLTRPSPYANLKTGYRSAIIAVVDNGTISFQRFGQTDFSEYPWVGDGHRPLSSI
ncbi:tRNA-splicing endonuclease subunit sen54 [Cystobasidiomycetes sp. EMM_F5]